MQQQTQQTDNPTEILWEELLTVEREIYKIYQKDKMEAQKSIL